MNDDKVFQLLIETNPIPDPDGLDSPLALVDLEQRSPTMATDTQIGTKPTGTKPVRDPNRRSRLLIGAAAAVLVVIVGLGTWAAFLVGDGQDSGSKSPPDVLEEFLRATFGGDLDSGYALLVDGAQMPWTTPATDWFDYESLFNIEFLDMDCIDTSLGAQCTATRRDDFSKAVGYTYSASLEASFQGPLIARFLEYGASDQALFFGEFPAWMEATHADVWNARCADQHSAECVQAKVDYAAEFGGQYEGELPEP